MNAPRKNVVLLGIGHTNAYVVKKWASDPIPNCDLICISTYPTATYSGMLPGTLGEQFPGDEMRIDLPELVDRAGAKLILAETCGLDLGAGEVQFSGQRPVAFDVLSIGVGSMPFGWQEHAESPLLVPIKPMQTFLRRLSEPLRRAKTPVRVAVVGGGLAGIELALCLQQRMRKHNRNDETSIELFTSSEHVAGGMTKRSIRRVEELLFNRSIVVHHGRRVTEVGAAEIVTDDGHAHAADCVIWATGAAPPPVLEKLGLQTDDHGFVATRNTLQSLSDPRVFAVGDSGTIVESPAPKAGVYAVRQSPILWHNLAAAIGGQAMKTFSPQDDFLKIINTGDGKALLQYGRLTAHARWCWMVKTWIDKRFIREFQA